VTASVSSVLVSQTISAIAVLLWPLIVLAVLTLFWRPLRQLLRSAEHREVTLKWGDQQITLRQLTGQQTEELADLRNRVADLEDRVRQTTPDDSRLAAEEPTPEQTGAGVLWVDDNPENNAIEIERLRQADVSVRTVLSTDEAVHAHSRRRFALIVSDMARREDGRMVADAGVKLVQQVRSGDAETPIVIYSASAGVSRYGAAAREAGANVVTSSAYELFREFRRLGLQ
jgi:CheY-like chemotaxis protein